MKILKVMMSTVATIATLLFGLVSAVIAAADRNESAVKLSHSAPYSQRVFESSKKRFPETTGSQLNADDSHYGHSAIARRASGKSAVVKKHNDLMVYSRSYDLSIGGKGVDVIDVNQPIAACGEMGWIFDSANIVIGKQTRFGDARAIQLPAKGCQKCPPLKIGYYWEPTGRLEYKVLVKLRKITGIC